MTTNARYNFEKFSNFNARSTEKTWSITKNYTIGLSAAWCEQHDVNKYEYCVLFYDARTKSIGVKFTSKNEPSKFRITKKEIGAGASIIARSFFKKQEIPIEKYAGQKYLPKRLSLRRDLGLDEAGYMFVIDLEDSQK